MVNETLALFRLIIQKKGNQPYSHLQSGRMRVQSMHCYWAMSIFLLNKR